jgi:hypothetical protein
MTDRDLGALLERASADLVEVDFAEAAWAEALAQQGRRRRRLVTGAGAVAACALAVTALQVAGPGDGPTPAPTYTTSTPAATGRLADGTAYAQLPLEGKEGELPLLDVGLPQVVDPHRPGVPFSDLAVPVDSPVLVYLRPGNRGYVPVVVDAGGRQYVTDTTLRPVRDRDGNESVPLGARAVGGGALAFFPQPGKVVRLDLRTGATQSYAVPSPFVQEVAWVPSNGEVVVSDGDEGAWTVDPWKPGAVAVPVDDADSTGISRMAVGAAGSVGVVSYDLVAGALPRQQVVAAPVTELWQRPVGSATWVASAAFLDQYLTAEAIRRGNGPIYQGIVAAQPDEGRAVLLLAPENPDGQTGRFKGCCTPLAWWNASTLLLQTVGSHGSWVLAWDVDTGTVYRVTQVEVDPSREEVPRLALNVGWRY